jgi:hypothetical protein
MPFYLGGPSLLIVVCTTLDLRDRAQAVRRLDARA